MEDVQHTRRNAQMNAQGRFSNPQGICKYFDEFDSEIESCAMYDLKCRAICDCLDGFYGMDCSINRRSDYDSIRAMKESLCLDLYGTLNIQDLDGNVIAQRAETVTDALLDPNLITDLGFVQCSYFMVETITKAPLEAASDVAIAAVYQALSAILEGDRLGYLPFTLMSNVTDLVEVVATQRQYWLAVGEKNVPYIADNLRVQIVKDYYEKVSNRVYSMPMSDLDKEYDTETPTAALVSTIANADNSYNPLGVTVIQYSRNIMQIPKEITTSSSFIGVYYNMFDNKEPNDVVVAELTTLNNFAVNYTTGQEFMETGRIFCELSPDLLPYNISVSCPFVPVRNETCPGFVSGNLDYNCSTYSKEPLCVLINEHSGTECLVGSFSPYQSTCRCRSSTTVSQGLISYRLYTQITEVRTPFVVEFTGNPMFEMPNVNGNFVIMVSTLL